MKLQGNLDATTISGCCAVRDRLPALSAKQTLSLLLRRKWSCRVSKSTLLVLPKESLLACTVGALTLLTVSTGASLWKDSPFFLLARGIEQVPQDDRD